MPLYDSQSRLISTKNISGETKQEFDGYGNLVTTTDALNDMTKHSYDKLNRLLATKEASGAQQSMTFNGRAKTHTIDENATTSIEYDLLGRVESRTPPGRGKIKYKYDTVGNLLSIENGEGLTTTWTYDSLNRPRTETDPNGFTTYKSYDLAGNLISVVDPLGHETISVYDALNRLVSTTDALQYTTYMSYDASGNRLSLTDPDNNKTQWTYDSFDRVLTETNQLNNTRSYAYYSDGREKLLTKADGNQIRYTYDLAAHTSKEEWLNGSGAVTKTLDFQYDAVGDLLYASDSDSSVHWRYESGLLRQESLSLPNNIWVQFVNRYKDDVLQSVTTKLRGIQDSKVAYSYTADGLLEQIQQTGYNVSTKSVRYSYDQAARRTSVTRFTDVDNLTAVFRTDYRYTDTSDQQTDRLQSLKHKTALSSLVEYKFVWDAASRLKSVESPGGDGLSSFTYDTVNQLTGATYSSNISNLSFSYDSNGNRNNADNVPGVDNRQQSDSEWTYQYDDNGNLVRQTNKSNGSVVAYTFDVRNRLTDVSSRESLGGTLTKGVHYGYDAINRRISRALDSNGDGSADVMEYFVNYGQRASRGGAGDELALVLKGDGEVKTRVLHGALVDEVLAEENVTSPTNRDVLWALADQQGSVRDLARVTNGQVQVVNHIQYDAFGNTVSETDTAIAHLYGYSGREFDKDTGLQYNRARYYDPSTGRWMSKDPISFAAGDTNLYRMTGNHPNMANDPSGLDEKDKPKKPRVPSAARGQWISGTAGNGVFEYADTPQNRTAGVAKAQIRFSDNHIAIGGFPDAWHYGGSRATSTVTIPEVLGSGADFDAADAEMRKLLKDPKWQKPSGYTWNHAGGENSRLMELVESEPGYKHGAVAHRGSAAGPRAVLRSANGAFGALTVYMTLRDLSEHTGEKYTEVNNHVAVFYDGMEDSAFVVTEGNWIYSPRAKYVSGSRSGEENVLSSAEFKRYKKMYHDAYGEYIPGIFGLSPRFVPGTERKTLPTIQFGSGFNIREGYIDREGVHWCDWYEQKVF